MLCKKGSIRCAGCTCRNYVSVQVGAVQEGVRYTDELPTLHKEIKRDVYWIGAIHAQANRVCKGAVRLTEIVKAAKGLVSPLSHVITGAHVLQCINWLV
jgi:hypothetical protein